MAGSEEQKEGDDRILKLIKDGSVSSGDELVLLSQEEVDALLHAGSEEEDEVDVIDDLVTDALIAKLELRRQMVKLNGYVSAADWRDYYEQRADMFRSSLDQIIAEPSTKFSSRNRKKFSEMGIITFRDLCLLSEEELKKAGFTDPEITSILLVLNRFDLFLMG